MLGSLGMIYSVATINGPGIWVFPIRKSFPSPNSGKHCVTASHGSRIHDRKSNNWMVPGNGFDVTPASRGPSEWLPKQLQRMGFLITSPHCELSVQSPSTLRPPRVDALIARATKG